MSYWHDRDPREVLVAIVVFTLTALSWLAHEMTRWSGVVPGVLR